MTKFEEMNELLKSGLQQIDSLRKENEAKYWLEIAYYVLDHHAALQDYIDNYALKATLHEIERRKRSGKKQLPVHLMFDPQRECLGTADNYVPDFYPYMFHLVHVVAHNPEELTHPKVVITTLLHLPEGIYMLMFTQDNEGMLVDVFPPHFWSRYLYRVQRNSLDTSHLPPAEKFKEIDGVIPTPTFQEMKYTVGFFIGRNWMFRTVNEPELMSKKAQKNIQEKDKVTIFVDGYSWDNVYSIDEIPDWTVVVHKSYFSWSYLKDDQRAAAVVHKRENLQRLLADYPLCLIDFLAFMS